MQTLQSTDRTIPYLLLPAHDESVSSWLVRLARKHYSSVNDFCTFFGVSQLLKSDLDLKTDLSELFKILPTGSRIPNQLILKIPNFQWKKGRSNWLIEPNKSGSVQLNSFTKICISCLKKRGYYQLKWKLELFVGCAECNCYLIEKCPKCKNPISPIKSDLRHPVMLGIDPMYCCWFCEFDFRKARIKKVGEREVDSLMKINQAYDEDPPNLIYLEFLMNNKPNVY